MGTLSEYLKDAKELLEDPQVQEYFKNIEPSKREKLLADILKKGVKAGLKRGEKVFKVTGNLEEAISVGRAESKLTTFLWLRKKIGK